MECIIEEIKNSKTSKNKYIQNTNNKPKEINT